VLRRRTDQAFVMDFGRVSSVQQPLTNDPVILAAAVRKRPPPSPSGIRGTAIFDAIFRACFYEFGKVGDAASGNFILLFSDGEDNASNAALKDAVDICQRNNTAIYAFRSDSPTGEGSTGPATLAELAQETGGRVFPGSGSADEVAGDLRIVEADLRNQYRLVYKPAGLKHDASFHPITLEVPDRVDSITIRSGYYAPAQ
jgi:Ca-activated chloride channel family protein